MFCLFLSLTFGFFLCFTSVTSNMNTASVPFSMLKIFFGYIRPYGTTGRTSTPWAGPSC